MSKRRFSFSLFVAFVLAALLGGEAAYAQGGILEDVERQDREGQFHSPLNAAAAADSMSNKYNPGLTLGLDPNLYRGGAPGASEAVRVRPSTDAVVNPLMAPSDGMMGLMQSPNSANQVNSAFTAQSTINFTAAAAIDSAIAAGVIASLQQAAGDLNNRYLAHKITLDGYEQDPASADMMRRMLLACIRNRQMTERADWATAHAFCLGEYGGDAADLGDLPAHMRHSTPGQTSMGGRRTEEDRTVLLSHLLFNPTIKYYADELHNSQLAQQFRQLRDDFVRYAGDYAYFYADDHGQGVNARRLEPRFIEPIESMDKLVYDRVKEVYTALGQLMMTRCLIYREPPPDPAHFDPFSQQHVDFWSRTDIWGANGNSAVGPNTLITLSMPGWQFKGIIGDTLFSIFLNSDGVSSNMHDLDCQALNPGFQIIGWTRIGFIPFPIFGPGMANLERLMGQDDFFLRGLSERVRTYFVFSLYIARGQVLAQFGHLERFILANASAASSDAQNRQLALSLLYRAVGTNDIEGAMRQNIESLNDFIQGLYQKMALDTGNRGPLLGKSLQGNEARGNIFSSGESEK